MEPEAALAAEGVWRIPTPLPFRPRTVHAYLLATEGGGRVLVDGGANTDQAWDALLLGLRAAGSDIASVTLHVVTHMHIDHIGLAGRIRAASGAPLAMGRLDAERAASATSDPREEEEYRQQLLRENGAPEAFAREILSRTQTNSPLSSFVHADHSISDEPAPLPGAPGWMGVGTPGHTAGHIALFRHADRLLVGGDAVLPRVSATIGVNRQRPDPVGDYLGTLRRLRDLAPRCILPGHGDPILDPMVRMGELEAETRAELRRVQGLLTTAPSTAWEIARARYAGRDLPPEQMMQALRETLAHLRHLVASGAARSDGSGGLVRFSPAV